MVISEPLDFDQETEGAVTEGALQGLRDFCEQDAAVTTEDIGALHFQHLPEELQTEAAQREVIDKLIPGPKIDIRDVRQFTGVTLGLVGAAQGTEDYEAIFFATVSEAALRLGQRIDGIFAAERGEKETIEQFRLRIRDEAETRNRLVGGIQRALVEDAQPEKEGWVGLTPLRGSGSAAFGPFFSAIYGADAARARMLRIRAEEEGVETPEGLIALASKLGEKV